MDNAEVVTQFCSIVNCSEDRAKFFLGAAAWNLEAAIDAFYANPEDADMPDIEAVSQPASEPARQPPTLQEIASKGAAAPKQSSRFGTIASLNTGDDDSSDDGENDHYAGGSKNSGQLIKGHPKDKVKVQDVFNSAKEHGAEVVEDFGAEKSGKKPAATFGGSGFRLGNEPGTPSVQIAAGGPSEPPPEQRSTITFWKGGFSVNDGPLRTMDDPANREFLSAVMKGEIPQELVRLARGAEVHVNMVDKRTEEFTPPKIVLRPFSGAGHKLGSPVPEIVTDAGAAPRTPTNPPSVPSVNVDESAPHTSIQIRLADGTRLVSKFNHSHTIGDIRSFINLSRPGAPTAYKLMTTFPNKTLSEEGDTVSQAGLLNAVIVQKRS